MRVNWDLPINPRGERGCRNLVAMNCKDRTAVTAFGGILQRIMGDIAFPQAARDHCEADPVVARPPFQIMMRYLVKFSPVEQKNRCSDCRKPQLVRHRNLRLDHRASANSRWPISMANGIPHGAIAIPPLLGLGGDFSSDATRVRIVASCLSNAS